MAGDDRVQWHSPLKAPVVEILDISADDEPAVEPSSAANLAKQTNEQRDALSPVGDDVDGDSDEWSLFGDYVDGIEDDTTNDNGMSVYASHLAAGQ